MLCGDHHVLRVDYHMRATEQVYNLDMAIALVIIGVLLVALSDRLQPDSHRKPKMNMYLGSLGGIIWLVGIVLAFVNYKLLHAVLLLLASFLFGAIVGVRK